MSSDQAPELDPDDDLDDEDLDDLDDDDDVDGDELDDDLDDDLDEDELGQRLDHDLGDGEGFSEDVLASARAAEAELAQVRARLADVAPEVVIVNHAMGLYELGAIHLSAQPPRFAEAALAIDAFACLVEGMQGRLGPDAATLQDALSQIRLAFVQLKGRPAG